MGHNKNRKRRPLRGLLLLAAIVFGPFLAAVAHDSLPWIEEDTRIIWVCQWDGDGGCGPGAYDVIITPSNLFRWR